jgi:hypothetical protein
VASVASFAEYNPLTGVEQWVDATADDHRLQVQYKQDVEPLLEVCKAERNDGLTDYGIKQDLWLYARIPPTVILKLRFEHGIDIFKRDHLKRAFEIINRDYPYLKCTEKRHTLKN